MFQWPGPVGRSSANARADGGFHGVVVPWGPTGGARSVHLVPWVHGAEPPRAYFLPAFFLPAMVLRGPLLERALVLVR
jgi:hypothetical protein